MRRKDSSSKWDTMQRFGTDCLSLQQINKNCRNDEADALNYNIEEF